MNIRYLELCSGIGGFRAGFDRAGGYECVGRSEIDKHADAAYRRAHNINESEVFYEDIRTIDTDTLPEFDLLVAGFPCQPFSHAGLRQGFSDTRGTIFFDIARILKARKPPYLLLENVLGLLSHDKGRTFAAVLHELSELGYIVEWQIINSTAHGVAQSRRRVFIVGYTDRRCAGAVLPIFGADKKALKQLVGGRQIERVYDPTGLAKTLTAGNGGVGVNTGLYLVGYNRKDGFTDKVDEAFTLRAVPPQIIGGKYTQNVVVDSPVKYKDTADSEAYFIDLNINPKITPNARCITARYNSGVVNHKGSNSGVLSVIKCVEDGRIRKLMPRECFRLQGFTDTQIDKLLQDSSDTQAYKQAGNAVTVNVVHALALRLKRAHEAIVAATLEEMRAA